MTEPPKSAVTPSGESRVIPRRGGRWQGIAERPYQAGNNAFPGVLKQVLAAPPAAGFEVRYFEVAAGAHTRHERHQHVHVVICLRGRGQVRLGPVDHDLNGGDLVYVAPGEAHRFTNTGTEPFGFICVVDQQRDRPVPIIDP